MNQTLQPGQVVRSVYKTGEYIGEFLDYSSRTPKAKIRIKSVVKHPQQGDIHHKGDPDVPLFHQRKALAFNEVALIPVGDIHSYDGEIPEYEESLRRSFEYDLQSIQKTARWAELYKQQLLSLKQDYNF